MRIAVCDDDRSERDEIVRAIQGWDPTRVPEEFSDGVSFLNAAAQEPGFTIAFLDIYLPNENGVDIAGALAKTSPDTALVFTTTSREHAVDAFKLGALHYLVKPVTTEGVREAFARLSKQTIKNRPMLVVPVGREKRSLFLDEIGYLQSADHCTDIIMADGRSTNVRASIAALEEQLDLSFLRIQRGVIVNMNFIEQMRTGDVVLRNGITLLISRKDKQAIQTAYNNYMFSALSERRKKIREVSP